MAHAGILVTGATGDTGGYTVEQLLKRNYSVRALAHRQDARSRRLQELGAEVVIGDFLDLEAMRAAMQGIRGAYFCYPIRPGILQATAYFAQAAKEAGVEWERGDRSRMAHGARRHGSSEPDRATTQQSMLAGDGSQRLPTSRRFVPRASGPVPHDSWRSPARTSATCSRCTLRPRIRRA